MSTPFPTHVAAARGVVTKFRWEKVARKTYDGRAVIVYSDRSEHPHKAEISTGESPLNVGTTVTVRYNPRNPADMHVDVDEEDIPNIDPGTKEMTPLRMARWYIAVIVAVTLLIGSGVTAYIWFTVYGPGAQ